MCVHEMTCHPVIMCVGGKGGDKVLLKGLSVSVHVYACAYVYVCVCG